MRKSRIIRLCAALVALAAAGAWAVWSYCHAEYSYEATRVEIPEGTPADSIPVIMRGALGNSFGGRTALLWRYLGGNPATSHGSYAVEPGDKVINVANRIAKGRQTPVRFTFNNLRRFSDLAARAGRIMEFDSAAFMAAADSILAPEGFSPGQYSAAVLPDTYEFFWTASPQYVLGRIYEHRKAFWTPEREAKAKALGLTPAEVHTVASIVEEETANREERPVIARLYLNRLDKDMMLQADPTVKFALGDFSLRRITAAHTTVDSPYNTYRVTGLPPGPIRIAEAATIDGVLDAPEHEWLYMCANSDFSGTHVFAKDYARHRINAARYHRALNARGIK